MSTEYDVGKGVGSIKNVENVYIGTDSNKTKKEQNLNLTSLPPKNTNFIGRVDELKEIEKQLEDDNMVYVVNGIGGVGKSELSYEYLHLNKDKYKRIAFIELTEDDVSLEDKLFIKFKESMQLSEGDTFDTIIQRLQGLPSKNLLLLDNLSNRDDFEKIKALNINFDLLITTRIKDIDIDNQLDLTTLNDTDARELFLRLYNTDDGIKDILKYLDNHPPVYQLNCKITKV